MIKYEYRKMYISPGGSLYDMDLNAMGKEGFHLVGILDLVRQEYVGENWETVPNGTEIIFERPMQNENGDD